MNDNETADRENLTEPQPQRETTQADLADENVGESAKLPDISDVLARLGVDLPYLQALPRGTHGRPWPPVWKLITRLLYVTAGYSPTDIARILPDGPAKETIRDWLDAEHWQTERDRFVKGVGARAMQEAGEDQAATFARHVKDVRAAQSAARTAIINKQVEGKSLEGVIAALAALVKLERSILGLGHAPKVTVPDYRSQILRAEMQDLPPEKLRAYFDQMRKKLEAETALREIVAGAEAGGPQPPEEDAI